MKIGYNWIDIIQDYLLPPTCILCGNTGFASRDLCYACYIHLFRNNPCCYRCGESFEIATEMPCGRCQNRTPAYDRTYAPFTHQGAMRHLITSLKFHAQYKNARLLGQLLAEHVKTTAEMPDRIMPVPLHKARYRQRGFNQSLEIARTVARELQLPLDLESCRRHRNTPHQTDLPAKQRRKNLKNAFSLVKPIQAGHIAIIDDVMTTGSTVNELATLLKKAGVGRVDVWACARA
ncbi:MAG: ComF family protein [Methylobacter sp.]|uniref:ComF family protein n=1 Tax=Methylobacter sp. TaxID=2051955 RepID=UPI00258E1177|nr:ComF family protein [Methylobacter sp.]MCL7420572.1 ComF family protein [Methylobacter sp.]